MLSLVRVSLLPILCERISIWILLCLDLGDSFGGVGGEIISSSLEDDVCSSEVSDIRDLFDFFGLLFIGPDESDSELEPFPVFFSPLFLFEVLQVVWAPYSRLTSILPCVVGVVVFGTLGAGFFGADVCDVFCLLGLLPVVLLTVAVIASRCFYTSLSSRDPLPLRLSIVSRAPAILFSRS